MTLVAKFSCFFYQTNGPAACLWGVFQCLWGVFYLHLLWA